MSSKIGYRNTEIGEIPEDWEVVKLEDHRVSRTLKAGGTPLRTRKEFYEGGTIPFVRIEDITKNEKYIADTELKITELGLKNSSTWIVPERSILFSMYASFGETVINKVPVATNQAILAIVPSVGTDLEYLYYALKELKPSLRKFLRETTQKNLNAEIVRNLQVAVPPLPEQCKIASILSTVDEAIQKTDDIIAKTKQLKRGLMQQLLTKGIGYTRFKQTEIGEISEEWEVARIGDTCEVGTGGTPSTAVKEYYENGTIKWMKSADVKGLYVSDVPHRISELGLANSNAVIHPIGSVMLAMSGRGKTRGMTTILASPCACSQSVAAIIPDKERLSSEFLHYDLTFRYEEIRNITGSYDRSGLNLKLIREIKVPLPPLPEQQKIASILLTIDEKLEKERQKKNQFEHMKKGLMQVLLTGKVRVKVD